MVRTSLAAAAAVAALAFVPSSASADAGCTLTFDVAFDGSGRFAQVGPGEALCAGSIGGVALMPEGAAAAISGSARPGADACSPMFESGKLQFRARRFVQILEQQHLEVFGDWVALAASPFTAITGTAASESSTTPFAGDLRYTPAGDCSGSGIAPGRLQVDLLLGGSQPAQRQQPGEPARAESEPAPAAASSKPKARRKRSCGRRTKSSRRRAGKRCRRARR